MEGWDIQEPTTVLGFIWYLTDTFPQCVYLYFFYFQWKKNSATESEKELKNSVKTEEKFKERSTPKITFRSALVAGNEIAFKKRKLNPDKKRNIRQTNPNKTEWREE